MKFNLEASILKIIVLLILALSLFSIVVFAESISGEDLQIEKNASVSAAIPPFQKVNIVELKNFNDKFLIDNYKEAGEIIVEDALVIEVFSNADWNLRLNNRNIYSELMIKKSDQSNLEWQKLNSTTAKFLGRQGIQKISFDLKYILDHRPKVKIGRNNLGFDLRFSIEPILY